MLEIGCAEGFIVPLVAAFGCLLVQPSKAATITYSVSGSYGPSTPATSLTAPNATFLFQFTVPLPASPTATAGSIEFTLSDPIIYLLTGSMATCNDAGEFFSHFFTPTTDSLGLTCENGSTIIDLDLGGTPILSTGSITAPVLTIGTFVVPASPGTTVQIVDGPTNQFVTLSSATTISNVPEPATAQLVVTGALAVLCFRRRML